MDYVAYTVKHRPKGPKDVLIPFFRAAFLYNKIKLFGMKTFLCLVVFRNQTTQQDDADTEWHICILSSRGFMFLSLFTRQ